MRILVPNSIAHLANVLADPGTFTTPIDCVLVERGDEEVVAVATDGRAMVATRCCVQEDSNRPYPDWREVIPTTCGPNGMMVRIDLLYRLIRSLHDSGNECAYLSIFGGPIDGRLLIWTNDMQHTLAVFCPRNPINQDSECANGTHDAYSYIASQYDLCRAAVTRVPDAPVGKKESVE